MPDTALPGLFPQAPPPPRPEARPEDRLALLVRLRDRRRELVDAYAVGLDPGGPLSPSAVQPLAVVQAAITAVEAELGEGSS